MAYMYHENGIDWDAPNFCTVFKSQTKDLSLSRNTRELCEGCGKLRSLKEKPFRLCTGCKTDRYCCKEHQVQDWPRHRAACKTRRATNEMLADSDANLAPLYEAYEIPSQMERKLLLEDFNEVHRHSIEQAMATLIREGSRPFDFYTEHIQISCSYRRESGGNPATAFRVNDMSVLRDPPSYASPFGSFRETMVQPDIDMRDQLGYMGAVLTNYIIDKQMMWTTCTYVVLHNHDIPKFPKTPNFNQRDWLAVLKYFVEKGLVFRSVNLSGQLWIPGLINKKGTKWVWKQKSVEELQNQGIDLTCRLRHDFDTTALFQLSRYYMDTRNPRV